MNCALAANLPLLIPSRPMALRQFISQVRRVSIKHFAVDLLIMISCTYMALYLRVGSEGFFEYHSLLYFYLPIVLATRVLVMIGFGCYSVMWRYISTVDAVRLARAVLISAALVIALTFFLPSEFARLPRSIYIIDAVLTVLGLMGARLYRRYLYEGKATRQIRSGKRMLIYGAGQNGRLLAHRYKSDASLDTHVIGFIDDDPSKANLVINGVPVLGDRRILSESIEKHHISQVIVAIPQVTGDLLREIVMATRIHNIRPLLTNKMTPFSEKRKVDIIRQIELSDLLNRPPREMDLQPVRDMIRGKCVLVTGAGGSIGSELARQIMSSEPARLLLLDHSEYALYEIDKELRLSTHGTEHVVPLLLDLKDEAAVRSALRGYAPQVVFHAAAYKHVHLVEANSFSAIANNVEGTRILLSACRDIDVKAFVQVSTDKAVNPAGVMGATKRVCELLVTSEARETGRRYCSVRFGNVLGSSGSLIPLLQSQIENGGPVTITHPDMSRFFMLIPEAVSLVLKAGSIANPGDINVLRMGEPVKIVDIARSLIALMGKTEEEIPIVFTGLRPGEKMFEELYLRGDELKTEHPDILTLPNGDSSQLVSLDEIQRLRSRVKAMVVAACEGKQEALFILNELVNSNYTPSPDESKDQGLLTFTPRVHGRN